MPDDVHDNPARHRFELDVDGHTAVAYYKLAPGEITFTHTEVPPELGGRGVGSKLAQGALDLVRARPESRLRVPVHRRLYRQAP